MTPELRNLQHIASLAFNEPLLLEPAYARDLFCALAGQLASVDGVADTDVAAALKALADAAAQSA